MYENRNVEAYITICKIDSQGEFAVWLRKLKQGLRINLEGSDAEGDRRELQKGEDICVSMRSQGNWRWEGPLGTPLGLVHWKRASSPVEAGTPWYL